MRYSKRLLFFSSIFFIIIVIIASFLIILFLYKENSSSQKTQVKPLESDLYEKITLSDIGSFRNYTEDYGKIVKIIEVERSGDQVFVTVQVDKDEKAKYKILMYSQGLNILSYWIASNPHIFNAEKLNLITSTTLDEAENNLKNFKDQNILLYIPKIKDDEISDYVNCNNKWIAQMSSKNFGPINCVPLVWSFTVYEKK